MSVAKNILHITSGFGCSAVREIMVPIVNNGLLTVPGDQRLRERAT